MMKVLGVLAGQDVPIEVVVAWCRSADFVIAADGAANRLIDSGASPDLIVGDLDSLEPIHASTHARVKADLDQETTDCDKLLIYVQENLPDSDLSIVGIEGDRFDHVLASLHSIARISPNSRLILRDGVAWFVRLGQEVIASTKPDQTMSLIPITDCTGVELTGVAWPPKTEISPLGATSISNQATGDHVRAKIMTGMALLVLRADTSKPDWS
ncbi:MAG: thiamine diphosphokinase [Chlorobia bacterium]|nr:thiamine diphosphokinase [Fimbriimonadaceae bacterium]